MQRRILIVDDNPEDRMLAERALRARGHSVRSTCYAPEARDMVHRDSIDLLVLDLELPGMNGFELIRQVRGRWLRAPFSSKPRILVATSRLEAEAQNFALRLGADALLTKPLDPRQFVETVDRLLQDLQRFTAPA